MITIGGIEIKSLAEAPRTIENFVQREFKVKDLKTLSIKEKATAIKRMDELGLFCMRGSVSFVSDALDISRVTVYKHLNGSTNSSSR